MYISRLEDGVITEKIFDKVNFDLHYDLICVGAGSAGVYAAYAAASMNIRTALIEIDDSVGGMHILGNVGGYYYGFSGGSYMEDDEIKNDARLLRVTGKYQQKQLKQLARLTAHGVDLRLRHVPTGLVFEGERVVGILVHDGERELAISASAVIDATSDGHLLRMCRVPKAYFDENGVRAPFTVRARYLKDGRCVVNNRDAGHIDQYDGFDFSRKAIRARAECIGMSELGELIDLPRHVGVREGLSFTGEESLTASDVLLGRMPERVLFYAYSDLDRHGHDKSLECELVQNWSFVSNLSTVTVRVPVPLGAIIPRGIRGIVTAGRCISADPHMRGTVRMTRDMQRMGECVAVAVAISLHDGCDLLDLDYEKYLAEVRARGCYDGDASRTFGFDYPNRGGSYTPLVFTTERTLHLLKTETPGPAVWSCYLERSDPELASRLIAELDAATDTLYRYNLAIALGIIGTSAALPTLREIIRKRDCFYYKDCRRTNRFRTAIALCLLGRLGTLDDVDLVSEIFLDPDEHLRPLYNTLPPDYLYCNNPSLRFVYLDFFTHAARAAVRISLRHGLDTSALNRKFREFRDTGAHIERMFYDQNARGTNVDPIRHELAVLLDTLIKDTN